ncbi:PqqD family protein [Azospirillaceae bacterium]|nr:hypothetical protein MTCCP1_00052 [uncultured bacterium]
MAGSLPLLASTTIVRNPELLSAAVDGEIILMVPQRGCYVGMNGTAGTVWERLAAPMAVPELIAALQRDFDGPPEQIANETLSLLNQMLALDLLTIVELPAV